MLKNHILNSLEFLPRKLTPDRRKIYQQTSISGRSRDDEAYINKRYGFQKATAIAE